MKKFVFSLQTLFDYKLTVEKKQKADLKKAQQSLQALRDEETALLEAYAGNEQSQMRVLSESKGNITAALSEHDAYFRYLRDALKAIRDKILRAEKVVLECQERLIVTMKEIKTYNKLYKQQYMEYLKEMQTEEEKEIGDLVSYNTVSSM